MADIVQRIAALKTEPVVEGVTRPQIASRNRVG